jgi:hypothetical protein
MKTLLGLFVLVLLVAATPALAATKFITFNNKSDRTITAFEVAPYNSGDWQSLLPEGQDIGPGKSLKMSFERGDVVKWDIFLVSDGEEGVWDDIDMRNNSRFTYTIEDGEEYIEWQ